MALAEDILATVGMARAAPAAELKLLATEIQNYRGIPDGWGNL